MSGLPSTLSPGQVRALRAFRAYYKKTGAPPSIRMLAVVLDIHPNAAHKVMRYLVRKGKLSEQPRPGRGYTLPELLPGGKS